MLCYYICQGVTYHLITCASITMHKTIIVNGVTTYARGCCTTQLPVHPHLMISMHTMITFTKLFKVKLKINNR